MTKLTHEDIRELGMDPNAMTEEEINDLQEFGEALVKYKNSVFIKGAITGIIGTAIGAIAGLLFNNRK